MTGSSATIQRTHANESQSATYFRFANNATGTLQGNGKLTYTNLTGVANLDVCALTNAGTVAPGAPTGTLELVNATVPFGSGSKLAVQIGGTNSGTYSALKLTRTGTVGGTVDLTSAGDTLQVTTLPTFRKDVSNTWAVVTAISRTGTFDTVILPDTDHWQVSYTATSVLLTYRAYPKGATFLVR